MYASVAEIRAASRNLDAIISSPDSDIAVWGLEAQLVMDRFCKQSFAYERHTTKIVRADDYILYFDKILSGDVSVVSQTGKTVTAPITTERADGTTVLQFGDWFAFPGKNYFLYRNSNLEFFPASTVAMAAGYSAGDPRIWNPDSLAVTADWGFAESQEALVVLLANELKSKYQAHRVSAVYHQAIDIVNIVASPDATDLASAITLINELKVDISSHFLDLGFHCEAETETIDNSLASDLGSAVILLEEMKRDFNIHLGNVPVHTVPDTEDLIFGSTCNPVVPTIMKVIFIRLVKRLAIRNSVDDILQINSYYESETTGDGYSFNLSNGTMRNLLRPEDRELLWPYVNHGRVIV